MELTDKEKRIIADIRELYDDEMVQTGLIGSCSAIITYDDGHALELTWHKQAPDA